MNVCCKVMGRLAGCIVGIMVGCMVVGRVCCANNSRVYGVC